VRHPYPLDTMLGDVGLRDKRVERLKRVASSAAVIAPAMPRAARLPRSARFIVAAMPDAREELKQTLGDADDAQIAGLESIARTMMAIAPHTDLTRELLARLGDRWSAMLLMLLATGPLRHNQLHRVIQVMSRFSQQPPISRRMLMLGLRVLERDGLVRRAVGQGNAPAVEYSLTPLGASLQQKLAGVIDWVTCHQEVIWQAQQAFDRRDAASAHRVQHRLR